MTIAATSSRTRESLLHHAPVLALSLAGTAVVLLALGPLGWRAGWWHFRFSFLTLMPWAAYFGIAALIASAVTLAIGRARLGARGIAMAVIAFAVGAVIAYVPWHYDQIRQTVPPIHDITTDPGNPPAFVAVVPLRQGQGINPVTYEGAKVAEQQRKAYPDIVPLTVGLAPDAACARYGSANGLDDRRVGQGGRSDRGEPEKPLDGLSRRYRHPGRAGELGQPHRPALLLALRAQRFGRQCRARSGISLGLAHGHQQPGLVVNAGMHVRESTGDARK